MVNTSRTDNTPWTIWQAIFVSISAIILSAITASFTSMIIEGRLLNAVEKNFTVYAVNTATLLVVALLFIKSRKISWRNFFSLPDKSSIVWLPMYYATYFIITLIIQAIFINLPWYKYDQVQDLGFNVNQGGGLILVFIALVVLPPLGEEVIFRGILYPGLKTKYKKFLSALITSVLFGLAHFQWNVGLDTFVLSLVMIFALEKHRSLWLPIGLHAIKNLVAFLTIFVFSR